MSAIEDLIAQYRGEGDANRFSKYRVVDSDAIAELAMDLLKHTPVQHGACAVMSAAWASLLRDRLGIPAVAVAGDLLVEGRTVYLCESNLPTSSRASQNISWDGHCWVEVGSYLGDCSIFRTARTIQRPSHLKTFIEEHFGLQRGLLLAPRASLSNIGMHYLPKYVLTETQIASLLSGFMQTMKR